jgi:uncharacterized protein (TIGR00251 family)
MRLLVSVKTQSNKDSIMKVGEGEYLVTLKAPARKGKANAALVKLLSKHFGRHVKIMRGLTSKYKVVEVEN